MSFAALAMFRGALCGVSLGLFRRVATLFATFCGARQRHVFVSRMFRGIAPFAALCATLLAAFRTALRGATRGVPR
eukprot:11013846-Lingulodinium_polyedra.AAC.1